MSLQAAYKLALSEAMYFHASRCAETEKRVRELREELELAESSHHAAVRAYVDFRAAIKSHEDAKL